ncbi:tRNA1(Val) A37 N6-methylase TrmN6 [Palleronia aestuarii]|uniref:tRNA1(Val) A37 N6-methylase TrmN6 n=1 Tax=Palleronia aestuarii TaxID=568105 RepID=A0A2W7NTF5_9RHOB|nr:methyltransferase [Palleronia aestuarii]PZX16616.1 tRNA1(Val) A37 N6-methylase TrmN6 [Palleronia aestuarii]
MTSISDSETTCDGFLGGRLNVIQPRRGYRAGIDPVLLAASIPARPGQSVLELGCGTGVALLCLGVRVAELGLTGLELQPLYADMARQNAARNEIAAEIVIGDVAAPPPEIRSRRFHHVIANPPYYEASSGTPASEDDREQARRERLDLAAWIDTGARRLLPRGTLSIVQRAHRLPDLLAAMAPRLGGLDIRPIQPRPGRPATLVIVHGVKESRTPPILRAPLVVHAAETHLKDGDDYSAALAAVLRGCAALP